MRDTLDVEALARYVRAVRRSEPLPEGIESSLSICSHIAGLIIREGGTLDQSATRARLRAISTCLTLGGLDPIASFFLGMADPVKRLDAYPVARSRLNEVSDPWMALGLRTSFQGDEGLRLVLQPLIEPERASMLRAFLRSLEELAQLTASRSAYHYALGLLLHEAEEPEAAVRCAARALQLRPARRRYLRLLEAAATEIVPEEAALALLSELAESGVAEYATTHVRALIELSSPHELRSDAVARHRMWALKVGDEQVLRAVADAQERLGHPEHAVQTLHVASRSSEFSVRLLRDMERIVRRNPRLQPVLGEATEGRWPDRVRLLEALIDADKDLRYHDRLLNEYLLNRRWDAAYRLAERADQLVSAERPQVERTETPGTRAAAVGTAATGATGGWRSRKVEHARMLSEHRVREAYATKHDMAERIVARGLTDEGKRSLRMPQERQRLFAALAFLEQYDMLRGLVAGAVIDDLDQANGYLADVNVLEHGQTPRSGAEDDPLAGIIEGRSVAIVGPADLPSRAGQAIDAHDVVIRMNTTSQTRLRPEHEGNRTTVSYFAASASEALLNDITDDVAAGAGPLYVLRESRQRSGSFKDVAGVRFLPAGFRLYLEAGPFGLQRILYDVLPLQPARVSVFNLDFYAGGRESRYREGHQLAPTVQQEIARETRRFGFARHDLLLDFRLTTRLAAANDLQFDETGSRVLALSEMGYLNLLEQNRSLSPD